MNGETGTRLRVLRGAVWATQEGDGSDYIVRAGESVVLMCPGMIVVQALEDSEVEAEEVRGFRRCA